MICRLPPVLSGFARRFNRWRLALVLFLLVYAASLLLYLDYALIQWDETQHLVGGLLLSRGQLQEYIQFSYYPPLFDVTTALTFKIMGPSVFSARLVALTFGILSVWAVFEYAYRLYGPKHAILSSILLASMPGFIILCRVALIETMLLFWFSIALLLFFSWMRTKNEKMLLLSGAALGLGFIAKYQIVVAGIVMLVSGLLLWRERIPKKLSKLLLLAIIAAVVALPCIFLAYQHYNPEAFGTWVYTLQAGSEERLEYGRRFPLPVFYLIEMTYPYENIHPISLPIYILAFLGLGYWLWRRSPEDKFSLIWFFVVYVFYTLFISNRNWRYVIAVFPILAVSASDFILFIWKKLRDAITAHTPKMHRISLPKVAAAVFVVLIVVSAVYSLENAYYWVEKNHVHIPVKEASQYVSENSAPNETAVVLFPVNYFSPDAVNFYLLTYESGERELWEYPEDPADVYKPVFNEAVLIQQCKTLNAKFLLLYEHGDATYFQSDWKSGDVIDNLLNSGSFTLERMFGSYPHRIFIIRFLTKS
jgi:4-amino-4-deoxy-L-arabinose transferase-like glycosyltransferase